MLVICWIPFFTLQRSFDWTETRCEEKCVRLASGADKEWHSLPVHSYAAHEDEVLAANFFCHIVPALGMRLSQLRLVSNVTDSPIVPTCLSV